MVKFYNIGPPDVKFLDFEWLENWLRLKYRVCSSPQGLYNKTFYCGNISFGVRRYNPGLVFVTGAMVWDRRHDIQHNDTEHDDTQHNDTEHNSKLNTTLSIMLSGCDAECHLWQVFIMLRVANKPIMLSVIMLNVLMLNVVAPWDLLL